MDALQAFRMLLRPISRRIALLAGRGVVRLSDDSGSLQTLQADLLKGETRSGLERFGQFGWTSRPPEGSELVALFFGGVRDHGVVVAVEDRSSRPTDLAEGESCAYNAHGVRILLKEDGSIEITANGGVKMTAATLELSGDLKVDGKIEAGGKISSDASIEAAAQISDALGSMTEVRDLYNAHTHLGVQSGSSATATPLPPMT